MSIVIGNTEYFKGIGQIQYEGKIVIIPCV